MYKVKELSDGMILWKGMTVIGVKGMTLPECFYNCDCYKLPGNSFDYELLENQYFTEEQLEEIKKAEEEWDFESEDELDYDDLPADIDREPYRPINSDDADELPF